MSSSQRAVVGRLIAKDLHLYRWLILGTLVAGFATLALTSRGAGEGSGGLNLGFLLYLTTLVTFGILVPMMGILKERQDKSRLFVLGLPVSPAGYVVSKVASAVVVFLLPWLTLTLVVVALTLATDRPDGALPFFVALMGFLLGNFATLTALVANVKSELWAVAGILVTNVSVTPFLVHLGKLPGVAGRAGDATATWSPEIVSLLAIEGAWVALALALAFWLPTRRRDFV
jgi:ABC-2 type transport system permease protein